LLGNKYLRNEALCIVAPVVVGSIPITHPNLRNAPRHNPIKTQFTTAFVSNNCPWRKRALASYIVEPTAAAARVAAGLQHLGQCRHPRSVSVSIIRTARRAKCMACAAIFAACVALREWKLDKMD
jgi:hypothetical protein